MRLLLLFFTVFYFHNFCAQPVKTIRVKKTDDNLYFFQKGKQTDTISKNSGELFYLLVKDKLRKIISIQIENGQLLKTSNDSIFKVNYLKGLSYECIYEKSYAWEKGENYSNSKDPEKRAKYIFKCVINGVSSEKQNKIIFRFKAKDEANPFLENVFYFKE